MRVVLAFVLAVMLVPTLTAGARPPSDVADCAPGESRLVVERFVAAFNARNLPALDRVFAPADTFNWFSSGAPGVRRGAAAHDRSTLIAYFKARQRQGEKLRLVRFQGNGNSNGYANFQFRLERRARNLAPTVYQGKGAAICATIGDTISVWSLGGAVRR
jgi:hypothetical protein